VNKTSIAKKIAIWFSAVLCAFFILFLSNHLTPKKIEVNLPAPRIKLNIGCFIEGEPIFMGDILGPITPTAVGGIQFYSLEWNTRVTLINASCVAMESRIERPAVKKDMITGDHDERQII
jgi:hypothetical protein